MTGKVVLGVLLVASLMVAVAFAAPQSFTTEAEEAAFFNTVVSKCVEKVGGHKNSCYFWKCMATEMPNNRDAAEEVRHVCTRKERRNPAAPAVETATDGDDRYAAASVSKPSGNVTLGSPDVASPCYQGPSKKWSLTAKQHWLLKVAMNVYDERANEHYSEDMNLRWVGINDRICPSNVPKTSDCSSTVTWIYWTLFGNGADFLNGEGWKAGYTGSLVSHGTQVSDAVSNLQVGDLCFYYTPMHHVAIYVGGGMVVSHGMDPVGYYSVNYAQLDYCRRYL